MKNLILLFGIALLGLSSCETPNYEKAVADWIQTDKNGTWTDLKFKLIEVIETKDITVLDSLQYLERKSDDLNAAIKKADDPHSKTKVPFSYYMKAKDKLKRVEAMKEVYTDREKTEILARLLKCKYSIVSPMLQTRQEKTETFLLTPEMKCIARMKPSK